MRPSIGAADLGEFEIQLGRVERGLADLTVASAEA